MTPTSGNEASGNEAFEVEDGGDLTVGIVLPDAGAPPTVQRFEAGTLVDWSDADPQGCDVVITAPGVDATGFARAVAGSPEGREDTGSRQLLRRSHLMVATGDGTEHELATPPFDIVESGVLDALPRIPKLDVRVEFRYHGTPFGDVATAADIVDGQVQRWDVGPQVEPQVAMGLGWTPNLDYRAGRIRPEDMLVGDLSGDRHHLMALFGLLIGEEWVDAIRLDGAIADVLMRWGVLWGSDAAREYFGARAGDAS